MDDAYLHTRAYHGQNDTLLPRSGRTYAIIHKDDTSPVHRISFRRGQREELNEAAERAVINWLGGRRSVRRYEHYDAITRGNRTIRIEIKSYFQMLRTHQNYIGVPTTREQYTALQQSMSGAYYYVVDIENDRMPIGGLYSGDIYVMSPDDFVSRAEMPNVIAEMRADRRARMVQITP